MKNFFNIGQKTIEAHTSHPSYIDLVDQRSFDNIKQKAKEILDEEYSIKKKVEIFLKLLP